VSQTTIETQRLIIRSFVLEDLPGIHRILDQTFGAGDKVDDEIALQERRSWLEWSILNQHWFPQLHQPPYGDRAVALKETRAVIGVAGLVPCLEFFDQLPELRTTPQASGFATPEMGLFWAIDPSHQRRGYATEAGQALIAYAFGTLRVFPGRRAVRVVPGFGGFAEAGDDLRPCTLSGFERPERREEVCNKQS